jgi:hypothetical protein
MNINIKSPFYSGSNDKIIFKYNYDRTYEFEGNGSIIYGEESKCKINLKTDENQNVSFTYTERQWYHDKKIITYKTKDDFKINDIIISEDFCNSEMVNFINTMENIDTFFNDFEIKNVKHKKSVLSDLKLDKEYIEECKTTHTIMKIVFYSPIGLVYAAAFWTLSTAILTPILSIKNKSLFYVHPHEMHIMFETMQKRAIQSGDLINKASDSISGKNSDFLLTIFPKISYQSQFDDNILVRNERSFRGDPHGVNKFIWAVTILKTDEPSSNIPRKYLISSVLTEHATIFIEGIDSKDDLFIKEEKTNKKGTYLLGKNSEFLYQGHLLQDGVTDKLHSFDATIIYTEKTETRYYSADKVKSLIRKIQKDKKENIIKWAATGEYSTRNYLRYLFEGKNYINCMDYVCQTVGPTLKWEIGDKSFKLIANTPSWHIKGE